MKNKIFNDPIYGLIKFPFAILYDLIEHPYFQRLRRIGQMGMANMVYTGVNHTRFAHALGATHLMTKALSSLEEKGISITNQEKEAACIAILLHDIGHGPFSHALEHQILKQSHEELTLAIMTDLIDTYGAPIKLAIDIFTGRYEKFFLHQLVTSQLDVDRLDYLARDSFYSGVAEGVVGTDRILTMLNVKENKIVVEEKGIYSIEKFLHARNIMYWQVYLHKTSLAAERMLQSCLKRAIFLYKNGRKVTFTPQLQNLIDIEKSEITKNTILAYADLDDSDILFFLKQNIDNTDFVLQLLCNSLIKRKIFKVSLRNSALGNIKKSAILNELSNTYEISIQEADYLFYESYEKTSLYSDFSNPILLLTKEGKIQGIETKISGLQKEHSSREKYFIIHPEAINVTF